MATFGRKTALTYQRPSSTKGSTGSPVKGFSTVETAKNIRGKLRYKKSNEDYYQHQVKSDYDFTFRFRNIKSIDFKDSGRMVQLDSNDEIIKIYEIAGIYTPRDNMNRELIMFLKEDE